jgi:hypothetical protein
MNCLDSIELIQDVDNFMIDVFKREEGLMGGFGKFRTPSKEEDDEYKNKIVYKVVEKIWEREIESLKLKKVDLNNFTLPVPQANASDLLLVSIQVVAGVNYEAIVSVILNDITIGIRKKYYKIKYFIPLQ